jgi:hypothetical protein
MAMAASPGAGAAIDQGSGNSYIAFECSHSSSKPHRTSRGHGRDRDDLLDGLGQGLRATIRPHTRFGRTLEPVAGVANPLTDAGSVSVNTSGSAHQFYRLRKLSP